MKNKSLKLTALLLAAVMLLSLCACTVHVNDGNLSDEEAQAIVDEVISAGDEIEAAMNEAEAELEAAVNETESELEAAVNETAAEPEAALGLNVNVMVLNGTTGFGMANLMSAAAAGETALNYSFSVETDASNVTAALVNGSADIAALPTNAASALYNKTSGGVQVLALNTLGVLYVVAGTDSEISSFEDLRGLTVYVPAQNPTFIFTYLCEQNGLVPGTDIFIDNSYAQPAELNTAVSAGEVEVAVLPEPMVTVAASSGNVKVVMDLTAEWDAVAPEGSLVQGCVVVRTEFAEQHPAEVAVFLMEYEASVLALTEDVEGSAAKIEECGILAKAAIAAKAIPNCNVCFITGEDMRDALSEFLDIMFETAPASIGGAVPADDFYYIG